MYKNISANLMVENVEETLDFYKNTLNFVVVASVPNKNGYLQFAILSKDNFSLMIQERNNFIEEYPILQTETAKPSISLYIQVDDFLSLYQSLQSKAIIYTKMHETFYGSKEFAILDNNGYVLVFTEFKK